MDFESNQAKLSNYVLPLREFLFFATANLYLWALTTHVRFFYFDCLTQ